MRRIRVQGEMMRVMSPTKLRGSGYAAQNVGFAVRFGSQDINAAKWDALRPVIAKLVEKGKPLNLPPANTLPKTVTSVLHTACERFSPQQMAALIVGNQFGLGEEAADIVYYLGVLAGNKAGVLVESRLTNFRESMPVLLDGTTPEAFERIRDLAGQAITPQDVMAFKKVFPLPGVADEDRLLKSFLAMILVDFAVETHQKRRGSNLADMAMVYNKMEEERVELLERIQQHYPGESSPAILLYPLGTATNTQALAQSLTEMGTRLLKTPQFTMANLLQFAMWKSTARTEYSYCNPHLTYNEVKQTAKAWEKLLEAQSFLLPVG